MMAEMADSPAAEMADFPAAEALKHQFSYLVNSIDTDALLPAALSRSLITDRQRTECFYATDPYKKAETFLGHIQRVVNGASIKFDTFIHILQETGQVQIASRLQEEFKRLIRSMQQRLASNSTDEEEKIEVPNELVEELVALRVAFVKLLCNYEEQLHNSPKSKEEFVKFLSRLFHRAGEDQSFKSHFNTHTEEEVSLFNITYLKQLCLVYPEDVHAMTEQLVDEYEQKLKHFMESATLSQFKQLFPATATSSRLSSGKVSFTLKLKNYWDKYTLDDLTKLVTLFGVSGSQLHLSKVGDGCIAVTWLCSTGEVKQLKMAVLEATDSLQTKGVLQVFIGGEELVLDYSVKAAELEGGPSHTNREVEQTMSSPLTPAAEPFAQGQINVHLAKETDIDYLCPICTEPLTEPYLSIECGHHLCRQCRNRLLSIDKTECPQCREPDVLGNAVLDKNLQRNVNSLKVCCSDYKEGCEWVGELRNLYDHLDPTKGRCGIACPFGCDRYARRVEMRKHARFHCPKRMISCENCGYHNTFTIVTEKHYPICPQSLIDCPNQHCQVEGLKRHQLEQHLNECSHQIVDCPNTGCSVQLPRGELKLHTLKQHKLMLEIDQVVAVPPTRVSPQYLYNQAPMEFIISDYHEKKENKEVWESLFYTHNRGYQFCLVVYPNGKRKGRDTHLSVYAQSKRGEYDNELKWPFEGDIRVELLNWREDKNHHSLTIDFSRYTDPDGINSSPATNQETVSGLGSSQFISHTDLETTTNAEYLRDDFFKLRVSVAVYSTFTTPLLIPAWQDPLISTQSGAQFTISECALRKQFNNRYYSPPFTTSPQGYKLCIVVYANGFGIGEGSHLSIYACVMKGQQDDHLQWPFTGTITIELLNWLEDEEHRKKNLEIDKNRQLVKVTKGEYGNCCGYPTFIFQSSLASSTKYLYNDCIRVRVIAKASD